MATRSSAPPSVSERLPLTATFLGVSTILLTDGQTAIMTDGFFSRPGRVNVAAGLIMRTVKPDAARIDHALKRAGVTRLAAILTAHSHYDHALDTAIVATRTGATIVGSSSTRNIALGLDFPDSRIRVIKGGEELTFGPFRVRVIASPHSSPALFEGEITSPLHTPARVSAYKDGGNYSFLIECDGRRVLIHPSANFVPAFMRGEHVDVVFIGIGTLGFRRRGFIRDYWREVVEATSAKLVIPVHWDNFSKPLDEPLEPMMAPAFRRVTDELHDLSKNSSVVVKMPEAFETFDLSAPPQ
jgi:L-ascorbate metabolism protein UlaG (beta-lactamase superfamily)